MALQYAGIDIDWNGYRIPNYLYGLYITDQYVSYSLISVSVGSLCSSFFK